MSVGRRLYYVLGLPVLSAVLGVLWRSYRVEYLDGQKLTLRTPPQDYCSPCYWHQDHVLCALMIRRWISRGFDAGFLVSDSVDGVVPARLAKSWGAKVVRGSANRTGAAAMRALRELGRAGTAIVTTADGPLGPLYEFKPGVAVTAKLTQGPLLPMAAAAEQAWYLRRWDNFMIPKPFSRVVIAVGGIIEPPASLDAETVEATAKAAQSSLRALKSSAEIPSTPGRGDFFRLPIWRNGVAHRNFCFRLTRPRLFLDYRLNL